MLEPSDLWSLCRPSPPMPWSPSSSSPSSSSSSSSSSPFYPLLSLYRKWLMLVLPRSKPPIKTFPFVTAINKSQSWWPMMTQLTKRKMISCYSFNKKQWIRCKDWRSVDVGTFWNVHEDKERVANMETSKVKEMERLEVAGGWCCKTFKSLNADPILFFSVKMMFQWNWKNVECLDGQCY